MAPNLHTIGDGVSGINTVVRAYDRILPEHDIELVPVDESHELAVTHAGMGSNVCDVAMLHGIYFTADYQANKAEWRANYHVVRSIRNALLVTVPSEWVARTIRRDFRIDPVIVPHGVFVEEWIHDHSHKPKTVLWAKNRYYDVCDPTPLNAIAARMPDFSFFTTVAAKDSPENVIEIGLQDPDHIKMWVQRVSMVISTVKETWGLLYAEALAAGTPVVAANYGHVPNLVDHGVSGYVYNRRNPDDIEYGIRWTEKNRDVLSGNASVLARQLSWQQAGVRLARVLRLAHRMKYNGKNL
jgi:glycosyltransferase involved in cell wall biosynthesis